MLACIHLAIIQLAKNCTYPLIFQCQFRRIPIVGRPALMLAVVNPSRLPALEPDHVMFPITHMVPKAHPRLGLWSPDKLIQRLQDLRDIGALIIRVEIKEKGIEILALHTSSMVHYDYGAGGRVVSEATSLRVW